MALGTWFGRSLRSWEHGQGSVSPGGANKTPTAPHSTPALPTGTAASLSDWSVPWTHCMAKAGPPLGGVGLQPYGQGTGRERQGMPGWQQRQQGHGPSRHASAGSAPWARQGRKAPAAQAGMGRSEVHSSSRTLALLFCSAHPGRGKGEKKGAAKSFLHLYLK